jgi:hypothetical protein
MAPVSAKALLPVLHKLGCHDWMVETNGRQKNDSEKLAGIDQAEQG